MHHIYSMILTMVKAVALRWFTLPELSSRAALQTTRRWRHKHRLLPTMKWTYMIIQTHISRDSKTLHFGLAMYMQKALLNIIGGKGPISNINYHYYYYYYHYHYYYHYYYYYYYYYYYFYVYIAVKMTRLEQSTNHTFSNWTIRLACYLYQGTCL